MLQRDAPVRDLRQQNCTGGYGIVAAYARRLQQAQGSPPGYRRARQSLPTVAEPACPPLTPRRVTWLVLRRETKRTEAEAQQLTQLHAQSPQSPRPSTWLGLYHPRPPTAA